MNGFEFPVEVVRTDRKRSMSVQLEDAGVKVRVPKSLSDDRVRDLIVKKLPWIRRKLKELKLAVPLKLKEYVDGEIFSYLGKDCQLKVLFGDTPSVKLRGGYLAATVSVAAGEQAAEVRSLLMDWYLEQAQKNLEEKTRRYAKVLGAEPKRILLGDYKSQWGSCSVTGAISYNWRIIIAPHRIVDYVVVHELSHIRHHNHSAQFWNCVASVIPDYRECRSWLRRNGRLLRMD